MNVYNRIKYNNNNNNKVLWERENKYVSECERVKKKFLFYFYFSISQSVTRTQKIVLLLHKIPFIHQDTEECKIHS